MNRNRFNTLVADYFDESLTTPACDELNAALRDDAELRRDFVFESHLHRQLYDAFQAARANGLQSLYGSPTGGQSLDSARAHPTGSLTTGPLRSAPIADPAGSPSSQPPGSPPILGFLAESVRVALRGTTASPLLSLSIGVLLASLCWVGLGIWITWWRSPAAGVDARPPSAVAAEHAEVAHLTGGVGCLWKGVRSPNQADALPAGELQLIAGTAEITLSSGVTLLIEGPTRLDLQTPELTYLHAGRLTAKVPRGAVGYTVTTPSATIVDLGTEFGVEVAQRGEAQITVFSGKVDVSPVVPQPTAQPGPRRVTAGQSVRVDSVLGRVTLVDGAVRDFARALPGSPAAAAIDRPAVRVLAYYRMGEDDPPPAAGNASPLTYPNALAVAAQPLPIEGVLCMVDDAAPRVSRRAMRFGPRAGATAVVGPGVPLVLDDWLLEAWVRAETADDATIAYFGDTAKDGFGLIVDGGEWAALCGGKGILRSGAKCQGDKWTHLALIRERKQMRLLVDGKQVSPAWFQEPNLPSESISIGGVGGGRATFHGLIDEVRFIRLLLPFEDKTLLRR